MKSDSDTSLNQPSFLVSSYRKFSTQLQHWLDCITPHTGLRWLVWCIVLVLYVLRTLSLQGWYIVTYAIGIFMLNQFIAFLTPKIDPAMRDYEEDGLSLPTKATEEFRPFMRQLPEFKFWYSTVKALLIGMLCTMFDFFNIPVFWPILVLYFIILFTITMKKQIRHMIKYKYIPFTYGKAQYRGKADTGKIVGSWIIPVKIEIWNNFNMTVSVAAVTSLNLFMTCRLALCKDRSSMSVTYRLTVFKNRHSKTVSANCIALCYRCCTRRNLPLMFATVEHKFVLQKHINVYSTSCTVLIAGFTRHLPAVVRHVLYWLTSVLSSIELCLMRAAGVLRPWFILLILALYHLLVHIVCFPTYPLFFAFSELIYSLIFSFENRPAPFPGQRS